MSTKSEHLVVHSREPFNAEPPLARLREHFVTAADDFYVRSHGNVPSVDPEAFRLTVGGRVRAPLTLSLAELKDRFAERTVEAVLQCAGNRRADLGEVAPVSGDPWSAGAIGNARWTGVAMADLLAAAGSETEPGLHVSFSGLDDCDVSGNRFRFGVSIPAAKAMEPDTVLAYAMNGAPLLPQHGFPLRAVVPGYAGVRSAKWLTAIEVCEQPSECPIQNEDYKLLPPDIAEVEDIDWSRGTVINEMPINSAICEPRPGAVLPTGSVRVRGWAASTGRRIVRVDLSADGGQSWRQASLDGDGSPWSWTFWQAELALDGGTHDLAVRAWDAAGQTQPASPQETWNVKGYLSSSWHRVRISLS